MCSTTPKTKAASPAVKTPSGIKKHPPLPAIKSLQEFLSAAYVVEKTNLEIAANSISGFPLVSKQFSISIRALFRDENDKYDNLYAQIPFDKTDSPPTLSPMNYTGSLAKVAAVYAALELRGVARAFAKTGTFSSQTDFLNKLDGQIDTSAAIQRLKDFGKGLKPDLKKIFTYDASFAKKIKFVKRFSDALKDILHNASATIVIDALGYSYINVSMLKGNYFDANTLKGIWLAGDYSRETSLKSVRVPTENDSVPGGSAQNINTKEMSRLFYMIHTGQCFPQIADEESRTGANDGAHAVLQSQGSWLRPTGADSDLVFTVPIPFNVDCTKLGIGNLGPVTITGPAVFSEGDVIEWKDDAEVTAFNEKFKRKLTGEFSVVWQNVYEVGTKGDALVRIIGSTIKKFLNQ